LPECGVGMRLAREEVLHLAHELAQLELENALDLGILEIRADGEEALGGADIEAERGLGVAGALVLLGRLGVGQPLPELVAVATARKRRQPNGRRS
jgi:hypothetical protein